MKRIIKNLDSIIVVENLVYKENRSKNNKRIREILEEEQGYFCAYTEYPLEVAVARDVEHFDQTLKFKEEDNYKNWFAVSHRWNVTFKQDELWKTFEGEILYPTDEDFEKRLWYDEATGEYLHNLNDIAAENLKNYLQINQYQLVEERINHIQLLKDLYGSVDIEGFEFWLNNPTTKKQLIRFRRAMETAFNVIL